MMNVLKVSMERTALQSVTAASMVQCHIAMLMALVTAVTTGWVTTVRLKVCMFVILHTEYISNSATAECVVYSQFST